MTPYYADTSTTVWAGDCMHILPTLPDNSVDAVCTDPPYGLEFMGKDWDKIGGQYWRTDRSPDKTGRGSWFGDNHDSPRYGGKPHEQQAWHYAWAVECLRILKPGGHLLAFGGTRTAHRLACAIEDAGFEIRDSIAWIYAQGFPKSLNVSNSEVFCQCPPLPYNHDRDDLRGVRESVQDLAAHAAAGQESDMLAAVQRGSTRPRVGDARTQGAGRSEDARTAALRLGQSGLEGWGNPQEAEGQLQGSPLRPLPAGPGGDGDGERLRRGTPPGDGPVDRSTVDPAGVREPHQPQPGGQSAGEPGAVPDERGPQARGVWPVCAGCGKPVVPKGLGTAAKPAHEPIVVARKPLTGTVSANVLRYGTGALNIDAARIGTDTIRSSGEGIRSGSNNYIGGGKDRQPPSEHVGRWPANVALDESQAAALDQMSGDSKSPTGPVKQGGRAINGGKYAGDTSGNALREGEGVGYADQGGASRFFYTAKASTDERITLPKPGSSSRIYQGGGGGIGDPRCTKCGRQKVNVPGSFCVCPEPDFQPDPSKLDRVSHPTVKPLDLMRWLVRLVTPPGGAILEPFAGSGTTVEAALLEGFRCIAIEREPDYLPLIVQRINRRRDPIAYIRQAGEDLGLFAEHDM